MKKLFATTALIAASALSAPAHAELDVTLSGFASFQAAAFDNDSANNTNRDFQSESQIILKADATADNGLQYGARIALDTSTDDTTNADEAGIYLAGAWGRVELGDDDGAAAKMIVYAPTVGVGQINGSYDDYIPTADRGHNANNRNSNNFTAWNTEDTTKVTYYTPKIAGVQAGVSYMPDFAFGEDVSFTSTGVNDAIEAALAYNGEIGPVGIAAAGSYVSGNAPAGFEDINAFSLGLQLSHEGFTIGGGYTDQGDSLGTPGQTDDETTAWNVGVTYEKNAWGVGLSYLDMDFGTNGDASGELGTDSAGGSYTAWSAGAVYKLAPGLTVGADLAFFDRNRAVGADTDGYVLVTDVTAAF